VPKSAGNRHFRQISPRGNQTTDLAQGKKDPKIFSDTKIGTFCRDSALIHRLFTTYSHREAVQMNKSIQIVTITLNPAIDQTIFLPSLQTGSVNRAEQSHHQAGGKGVNASARLGEFGLSTTATGFLGAENQAHFTSLFSKLPIRDAFVRIPGHTRTGIKLVERNGQVTTDINLPGAQVTPHDIEALHATLRGLNLHESWCLIGGSLPPGFTLDHFAELIDLLKSAGARVAVDASGDALRAAIDHKVDLIKPNQHEISELLGRDIPDLTAAQSAAREVQAAGITRVIVSLGDAGALFLDPCASLMAKAPPIFVASTVGAGDALLAGYLAGLSTGLDATARAQLATTFARYSLTSVGRQLPPRAEVLSRMGEIDVISAHS
jgi:1-phosphofructokinase